MRQAENAQAASLARRVPVDIESHVRQIVEAAPPLTPEQRDRLAVLLRGGATG